MRKKLFIIMILSKFLLGEVIKDFRIDKNVIKQGEEIVNINIEITKPSDLRVSIIKDGRLIRILDNDNVEKVKYLTVWNGKDKEGNIVAPGKYVIKVEAEEDIVIDESFGDKGVINNFVSPYTLRKDPEGNIWVLDKGEKTLCKFDKNGKPLNEFDGDNKLNISETHNFVIDKNGFIYISSGSHQIYKMDKKGNILMKYGGHKIITIDGKSQRAPESTTWAQVLGLGQNNKIYIYERGGSGLKIYNRGFNDFGGFLYSISNLLPACPKTLWYTGPSGISSENTNIIYWLWHTSWLSKFIDTGEELKELYRYTKTGKNLPGYLVTPTGIGTNWLGEIYVANLGNCRIEKFFDNGSEFKFVKTIGSPGKNIENKEFFGIHDIVIDEDCIYVIENGEKVFNYEQNKEYEAPGNHRISKWFKKFKETKLLEIEVK